MNRELFVKVATTVLRQMADPSAAEKAEAIAAQMDIFAAVMGDAAPPAAVLPPPLTRAAFPSVNPAAIMPVEQPRPAAPEVDQPDPFAPAPLAPQYDQPLVTLETRIPDKVERVVDPSARMLAPDPPAQPLQPQGRLKVEQLSQLVQDNTPVRLPINVPMEDGSVSRAVLERNVVSMHAHDSVQLIYYPANATLSSRELTEVVEVLHIDEAPFDFRAIVQKVQRMAALALRPRRIPQSAMPVVNLGPVKHADDTYQDPAVALLTGQTQAVFKTLG